MTAEQTGEIPQTLSGPLERFLASRPNEVQAWQYAIGPVTVE